MITATEDLNIFGESPEEQSIASVLNEIIPVNIPTPNSEIQTPLCFHVSALPDVFTDFSPTILQLSLKIEYDKEKDEEKKIPRTAEIGLINNALMSMFSGIEVSWNNQLIFGNNFCLPWTSYLDVLASYPYDVRKSRLSAGGWYDGGLGGLTPECKATFNRFYDSNVSDLIGVIELDWFKIRKYVPPNVETVIKLFRRPPNCWILQKGSTAMPRGEKLKVTIQSAYLHVKRVRLHDNAAAIMEKKLLSSPALYEFTEVVLRPIIVPEKVYSIDTQIHEGILPCKIDIVQILQSELNGPIQNNPFQFGHYFIKNLSLEKNGVPVVPPYKTDFSNSNYARMYLDYFRSIGCNLDRAGMSEINYSNYTQGYTIISFNLTKFDECNSTLKQPNEQGSIRLKIEYENKGATDTRPIVIMCLMRFNRQVALDHNKTVKFLQ